MDQIEELRKIFGDIDVAQRIERIDPAVEIGVPQILQFMKEEKAVELVCSIPIQHLQELIKSGVRPIRAIMARSPSNRLDGNNEREFDFEFLYFERVSEVKYKAEKL